MANSPRVVELNHFLDRLFRRRKAELDEVSLHCPGCSRAVALTRYADSTTRRARYPCTCLVESAETGARKGD